VKKGTNDDHMAMKLKLTGKKSSDITKKKKFELKMKGKSKGAKTVGEGFDEEVMGMLDS
jgi:hypothetical protein